MAADYSILPEQAQDLIRLIGLAPAMALVRELGGTTFMVPKGKTSQGQAALERLAEIIGDDKADILAFEYGSTSLYVPRCWDALMRFRNIEISREFERRCRHEAANHLVAELARRYRLSDRRIFSILKQTDSNYSSPVLGALSEPACSEVAE
ncbi:MAG: DNA transposition protein [Gammaproteobacteria bacterium]|nr:DNA transposition protein [Gammaproteobacteria bacterium]